MSISGDLSRSGILPGVTPGEIPGGIPGVIFLTDGIASGTFTTDVDNQASNNYVYDGNGVAVYHTSGAVTRYAYDSTGMRTKKVSGSGAITYYLPATSTQSEAVYEGTSYVTHNILGNDVVGQVKKQGSTTSRYYYLKDHLGTTKMSVDANGTVAGYDDYYPFGMTMDTRSYVAGQLDNRYRFTGKERDVETGYDYFGARYYDSRIWRWFSVDPLEDKYPGWSPYNYALGNPVNSIDPNGQWVLNSNAGQALGGKEAPYYISRVTRYHRATYSMLGPVGLTAQVAHPDPSYGILAAGISWSTIPEAARLGLTPSAKFALSYYGGRFSKLIGSAFGSVFGAAFMISDLVGPGSVVAFREEMLITALKDMGMVYSTVERGLDEQTYLSKEACGRLRMDQLNEKLRGVERGLEEMVNEFNMSNIKLDQEGFLDNSGKQERFRKFYEANKSRYLDRWKEDWNSDKD